MVQYPAEYNITYNTIKVFYPENEKPGVVGVTVTNGFGLTEK